MATERLRGELLDVNKPCGMLSIIVPSVNKIQHDHCYCSSEGENNASTSLRASNEANDNFSLTSFMQLNEMNITQEDILENLQLTTNEI
jgi:hypothetical protein